MPDDFLRTSTPVALVLADTWGIERLEITFGLRNESSGRLARIWVAAGKLQEDGSTQWLSTKEHVVSGEPLDQALGQPPTGDSIYQAAARGVYGLCKAQGFIPEDAEETSS